MDIFRLKRDNMIYIKQIHISYLDSDAISPILPSGPSPRSVYTKSIWHHRLIAYSAISEGLEQIAWNVFMQNLWQNPSKRCSDHLEWKGRIMNTVDSRLLKLSISSDNLRSPFSIVNTSCGHSIACRTESITKIVWVSERSFVNTVRQGLEERVVFYSISHCSRVL